MRTPLTATITLSLGLAIFLFSTPAEASNFSITPAVMDIAGLPRDEIHKSLTLQNNDQHLIQLFAIVNTLGETSANSPASSAGEWIEVSRGVITLTPGEKKEIPFVDRIHLHAKPGTYHATITFAESSFTRAEAESSAGAGQGKTIIINTTVADDRKEQAGVLQFAPTHSIFFTLPITFTVRTQNSGNVATTPYGDIRLINRRQEEKAFTDINPDKTSLSPGESKVLTVDVPEVPAGKFKAVLSLSYGDGNSQLQDTTDVWYIPLTAAVISFTLLMALIIAAGYLLSEKMRLAREVARGEPPLHTAFTPDEPPRPW
jgi:hypothetical protein